MPLRIIAVEVDHAIGVEDPEPFNGLIQEVPVVADAEERAVKLA